MRLLLPSLALLGSFVAAVPAHAEGFSAPPTAAVALPSPSVAVAAPAPAPMAIALPSKATLQVAKPTPDEQPEPRAGHGGSDALIAVVAVAAVGIAAADVGFSAYDTVKVGKGALPARPVGIAEAAVAAPQVVGFGVLTAMLSANEDRSGGPPMAAVVLLPGLANSMFVHGVWGAQTTIARPGALFGVSAAAGFDVALLTANLGSASAGHFSTRGMGIMQMVLTAPQIAASTYGMIRDTGNARGWAALTGASGALFAHGLVSTIVGGAPPEDPAPGPPPPPARPPLRVPANIQAAPMPIASGFAVSVRGAWM